VTKTVAMRSGSVSVPVRGGVAFYARGDPTNAYVAYPDYEAQIEVYDPWALGARRMVSSGSVTAIPRKAPITSRLSTPQGLTLGGLRSFASKVHHVLHWVGPKAGTTYEVTQTSDGKTFVRYLPAGTAVGTTKAFLTIGTYPVSGALADVEGVARGKDAVRLAVKGGAVAVYARSRPTNVYEAFPKIGYETEIFDPTAGTAHLLVTAGRVVPVL
jgi:hypothetical protein